MLNSRSISRFTCAKEEFVELAMAAAWGLTDHLPVEYGSYSSGMIEVCVFFITCKWIDLPTAGPSTKVLL